MEPLTRAGCVEGDRRRGGVCQSGLAARAGVLGRGLQGSRRAHAGAAQGAAAPPEDRAAQAAKGAESHCLFGLSGVSTAPQCIYRRA